MVELKSISVGAAGCRLRFNAQPLRKQYIFFLNHVYVMRGDRDVILDAGQVYGFSLHLNGGTCN